MGRVWRFDSGPNLQPCVCTTSFLVAAFFRDTYESADQKPIKSFCAEFGVVGSRWWFQEDTVSNKFLHHESGPWVVGEHHQVGLDFGWLKSMWSWKYLSKRFPKWSHRNDLIQQFIAEIGFIVSETRAWNHPFAWRLWLLKLSLGYA